VVFTGSVSDNRIVEELGIPLSIKGTPSDFFLKKSLKTQGTSPEFS